MLITLSLPNTAEMIEVLDTLAEHAFYDNSDPEEMAARFEFNVADHEGKGAKLAAAYMAFYEAVLKGAHPEAFEGEA